MTPSGDEETVPLPVPAFVSVSVKLTGAVLNVAVTEAAAATVTVHAVVPAQAPPQPAKTEPVAGVAVSVTAVPLAKPAEHVAPQLMPAGADVSVPEPVPCRVRLSV